MNAEQIKLGQRIKRFRLDRGWTQAHMAVYLGISRPLVIRLERGKGGNVMDLIQAKVERQLRITEVTQAVA